MVQRTLPVQRSYRRAPASDAKPAPTIAKPMHRLSGGSRALDAATVAFFRARRAGPRVDLSQGGMSASRVICGNPASTALGRLLLGALLMRETSRRKPAARATRRPVAAMPTLSWSTASRMHKSGLPANKPGGTRSPSTTASSTPATKRPRSWLRPSPANAAKLPPPSSRGGASGAP